MQIVSVLFVEEFNMRQVEGPSTRLDLTGVLFSLPAPSAPPVTIEPHLVALIHCPPDGDGAGVFEVVVTRSHDAEADDGSEPVARNVSPFQVEPGRFTYRLVRAEIAFDALGTVYAHCRIDRGPWTTVPLTLLPGG